MREVVDRLWQAVQEETQKVIDRLTQAINTRVAEAVAERDWALGELQATAEELRTLEARSVDQDAALLANHQTAAALQSDLAKAIKRADHAETRAIEIERRADDLGIELGRVHTEAAAERERQAAALAQLSRQFEAVRVELAARRAKPRRCSKRRRPSTARPPTMPRGWLQRKPSATAPSRKQRQSVKVPPGCKDRSRR